MLNRRMRAGTVVVITWLLPVPGYADEGLRRELDVAAKQIADSLAKQNQHSVALGTISRDPAQGGPQSSAGPALGQTLAEALAPLGITVVVRSPNSYTIEGSYSCYRQQGRWLGLKIVLRLLDANGRPVATINRLGQSVKDIVRGYVPSSDPVQMVAALSPLVGATADFSQVNSLAEVDEAFEQRVDHPQTTIVGERVSASGACPYAMELLTKDGETFTPCQPENRGGQARVKIGAGQVYAVRLSNRASHRVAVALHVDGLSVFEFSDARQGGPGSSPRYTHFVIEPGEQYLVRGWHHTNEGQDYEFEVRDLPPNAPLPALRQSASLGTVTAAFSACWSTNESAPPDGFSAPSYTERGTLIHRGQQLHETQQIVGRVRAVISICYGP